MTLDELKDNQQDFTSVHLQEVISNSELLTEQVIPLLEERLVIALSRRKSGEVVIRKEVEEHVIEVQLPIRREKLIVEQVSPVYKHLAEIDLGQSNVSNLLIKDFDFTENNLTLEQGRTPVLNQLTQSLKPKIYGEVSSLESASELIEKIENLDFKDCESIRIEITLKDSVHKNIYQQLFDHYA